MARPDARPRHEKRISAGVPIRRKRTQCQGAGPIRFVRLVCRSRTGSAESELEVVPRHHFLRIPRSEEHTSELQSLMRISYAVFCLTKNNNTKITHNVLTAQITH